MIATRPFQQQRGYTLVELMVAVVLASIVTVSIYKAYISVTTAYDIQDQVVELQQTSRVAIDRLVREIRMAGYDPAGSAGAGFTLINSSRVTFTMDLSGNGTIDAANETVDYSYDSANLQLDRNGTALVNNVSALNFVYLDENGAVTANPANVRTVQIAVVVRTTNEDYGYINTDSYANLQGTTIFPVATSTDTNPNVRRRVLTAQVKVRNLGL